MGAVDTPQPRAGKSKGKGFHRPKRRVGIRIDMTPMVDVAFLLLIFFMVTTVFRTPQALEINLPPDKQSTTQMAETKLLQLRVLSADRVFWKRGPRGRRRSSRTAARPAARAPRGPWSARCPPSRPPWAAG